MSQDKQGLIIRSTGLKVVTLAVGFGLIASIGAIWALVQREGTTYIYVTLALSMLFIFSSTRIFRGPSETDDPRAWWRLTGGVTSSFVVGALLLLQASSLVLPFSSVNELWPGAIVYLIAGGCFVGSALRMMQDRHSQK